MRAIKINKKLKKSDSSSWNQVFCYIKTINIIKKIKKESIILLKRIAKSANQWLEEN